MGMIYLLLQIMLLMAFNDVTGVATPMKNPIITCTKISNSGARAILKMVDKNGKVFNPKAGEIIQGVIGQFLKTMQSLIRLFKLIPP